MKEKKNTATLPKSEPKKAKRNNARASKNQDASKNPPLKVKSLKGKKQGNKGQEAKKSSQRMS